MSHEPTPGGLDLGFDEGQKFIADSVARFCSAEADAEKLKKLGDGFHAELWRAFAELGFLAVGSPEGEGGALEIVAALEPLGRAAFPGPLVETFVALAVLDDESTRTAVIEGESVVSLGTGPAMPLAPVADVFLQVSEGALHLATPVGDVQPLESLGGEPYGSVQLQRGEALSGGPAALVLGDVALAAYLAAAGRGLLAACAEHVATRKQFGRAVGSFQAVAHPLADCEMALSAAESLARAAACDFDERGPEAARGLAATARLSARKASLKTAYECHQKFGAIGITIEGPAHHVTRRIRQLASYSWGADGLAQAVLADFGLDCGGE